MAATTTLLQHPLHDQHLLKPKDFRKNSITPFCDLCNWKISAYGYACEECKFYAHRACAEAPPQIDAHPLHPDHLLTLTHCPPTFIDNVCDLCNISHDCLFRCVKCNFNLDIRCALSTLYDRRGTQGKKPNKIMLPLHPHKLTSFSTRHDFIGDSNCMICKASVEEDGYACLNWQCEFLIHKRCIQDLFGGEYDYNMVINYGCIALLDRGGSEGKNRKWIVLPLHHHLLTLISTRYGFLKASDCVICKASVEEDGDGYACVHWQCEFLIHKRCIEDLFGDGIGDSIYDLDTWSGSSTLLERGGSEGKPLKWIALPLHRQLLTLFSTRYDFVKASDCVICKASVEGDGDGFVCLHWGCEFLIHKRCVQDLYYTDGTKAPQVYHRHPLETFLGGDTGSRKCTKCGSDESSGEFIGCAECQVFYCRDCVQVPEIITYYHNRDNNLVLFINCPDYDRPRCVCCLVSLECDLCYGCPSCEFFMDVGCALQVLSRRLIKLPWHEDELRLCHKSKDDWNHCSYCEEKSPGPMYTCEEEGCELQLHARCTEFESTIIHPHHPDHPLTLCNNDFHHNCGACGESIHFLKFCCKQCAFYLHAKCAARFPTRKHPLHEHELLHLDNALFYKCNRCGTSTDASFFRCVPCNFNLHEECMELPLQVVNSKIHWHPLTLRETYIEDDSGEYYCDHCEKRRDERMGVYVCLQCPQRWAYHIECVFSELRKVCAKDNFIVIERLTDEISRGEEEVREAERKLDEMKRELEEKRKKRAAMIIIG